MINIHQLQYQYKGAPAPSLFNINLQIKQQSLFGLLGPNGAGKTTLLSILSGLLDCPAGKVTINLQDIACRQQLWKKKISLIPQEYAFYNRLSVIENLRFFAKLHDLTATEHPSRIAEAIKISQLDKRLDSLAGSLSGGLKRRLNLAIGLLNKPQLLLLDEPTVGIDPQSRHFILETIKRLNSEGTTVLYTSHYMEEVEALCDEVAIIDGGKILIQGTLSELLTANQTTSLRLLLKAPLSDNQLHVLTSKLEWPYQLTQNSQQMEFSVDNLDVVAPVLQKLKELNIEVVQIRCGPGSLEELFLNLTQRQLRD